MGEDAAKLSNLNLKITEDERWAFKELCVRHRMRVLLRGALRVSGKLSAILGTRPAGGLPSGSCTAWALESVMTRCLGS